MYIKTEGDQVAQYPYGAADLRRDNPNTSFPADPIPDSVLADFGVFPVGASGSSAYDPQTQRIEQGTPINANGQWVQSWVVVDLPSDEVQARHAALAQQVRQDRDHRITDFEPRILKALRLQRMGQPHEDIAVLDAYIQALADVPEQAGFPFDVQWPEHP